MADRGGGIRRWCARGHGDAFLHGQAQPGSGFAAVPGEVFDEKGVDQWPFNQPSSVNFVYANGDGAVWAFEDPMPRS